MQLADRRILVTGGSSGIGKAVVRAYVRAGALVWTVGRRRHALAEGLPPGSARAMAGDLTDPRARTAIVSDVMATTDALDVVVHAAGMLGPVGTELVDYPEGAWRGVFEVNMTAVHLLHQGLAHLLDRGRMPTVVGVSSSVGRAGRAGWGMYAISKFALEGWLETLADEWSQNGRVYSVNPGGTATPMRAAAIPEEDPRSIPSPDDITPVFLHLARYDCPVPSGSKLNARDWIGKDPWSS